MSPLYGQSTTAPPGPLQIHRELTQVLGYSLTLDGINYVNTGYRYVGVTYSPTMHEFLSQQIVGKQAWNTVLGSSEALSPISIYQFLPTVDGRFYIAFRTGAKVFGVRYSYSPADIKYLSKRFRGNPTFGWVFKNPLMYMKQSNKLFTINPFGNELFDEDLDMLTTVGPTSTTPTKSWSDFIADAQEGAADAVIDPLRRPYPYYPYYDKPLIDSATVSIQKEINQQSAMAIELRERMDLKEAKQRDAQIQALYAQEKAQAAAAYKAQTVYQYGTPVTRWYSPGEGAYWSGSLDSIPLPPNLVPAPEPATPKAKHGRMIVFEKKEEA